MSEIDLPDYRDRPEHETYFCAICGEEIPPEDPIIHRFFWSNDIPANDERNGWHIICQSCQEKYPKEKEE